MLSVEEYYEEHLKGKSVEEIKTCIRRLKRKINHCKRMVEIPDD